MSVQEPKLPPRVLPLFEQLYDLPLRRPGLLRAAVIAHRARIEAQAADRPFVDVDLAYRMVNVCFALLRDYSTFDDQERRSVQAACVYFARRQGAQDDDHDPVVGLNDDCEVLNYVCRVLDREDLVIALD